MKHSTTKFRRVMALTLALLLVVGLTGCFGKVNEQPTEPPVIAEPTEAPTEKPTEKPTEAPTEKPTEAPEKGVMGTVSANNLNVRSNHASDSAILSQLPVNLRVEILEQKTVGGTNWGRIGEMTLPNGNKIDGGWLNLHYVKLDNADAQTPTEPGTPGGATTVDPDEEKLGTITAQQLQIRKGAGTTYDAAGSYKKGDRVKILETKTVSGTTWGRTEKGWISMTYVKLDGSAGSAVDTGTNVAQPGATTPGSSSGTGTGTGTGTAAASKVEVSNGKTAVKGYVVVDTDALNLRSGPGTKYKSLGSAREGDRYPYYQISGDWYRTSEGWLSNVDKAYLYIEGTTADDAGIAVVVVEEMNVRQGPGKNFKSVTTLKKGEAIAVLGQADDWGYTRQGWINLDDDYVDFTKGLTYTTGDGVVLVDGLNVREEADDDSKILDSLEKKDKVKILAISTADKNWGKIEYATGKYGWIHMSYVKMTGVSSSTPTTPTTPSTSTTYAVEIKEAQHGKVTTANAKYAKDAAVVLTITPEAGYELATIEVKKAGGGTVTVIDNNKFFMPGENVTIEATFAVANYTITYKAENGTAMSGNPTAKYKDIVSLTAGTADSYYTFDKVVVTDANGKELPVVANQFEMPASNVTVTAVYKKTEYTITKDTVTNGKFEVPEKATKGTLITVKCTPNDGYELDTITVTGGAPITHENGMFFMPGENITVKVTFKAKTP